MAVDTDTSAPGLTLASAMTGMDNPPADDTPKDGVATEVTTDTGGAKTAVEPEIKPLVDDDTAEEIEKDTKTEEDQPGDMETAMRRGGAKESDQAAKEKADADVTAAEKKAQEDAAAAEKAKQTPDRDADLKVEHGAHTHPKTRKIITEFQAKAKAARDERDRIITEREALRNERDALAKKSAEAPVAVPKETEDELKTLRERVRELDIARDPAIETKYDKKIAANNQSIVTTLKQQGFGMVKGEDGKTVENPAAIAELLRGGLTFKTLNPLLKKLDEADLVDEAETIRDAIRQNNRLTTDRAQEIEGWKANYADRQKQRESSTREAQEKQLQAFSEQTNRVLSEDVAELTKDFSYLKQPPAPLLTDTPTVAKAKQTALDEYSSAEKKISDVVKTFDPTGAPPERRAEIVGRLNASAIQAVILKTHVLPKVRQELAANAARIKELETELEKIRGAGRMSRLQGGAPGDAALPGNGEQATDLESALRNAGPR